MRAHAEGFSARALAVGFVVGAAGAVSNVYVSLKVGWSLPVMTTAAVVGLAVARARRSKLAASEAVVLTSMASAAAFMTGGGNMAAIPALVLLGSATPGALAMMGWFVATAILGTLLAPMLGSRVRDLTFPTATASVALVRASNDQNTSARALWGSTLGGAIYASARALLHVPSTLLLPGRLGGLTVGLDTSLLLVGVGGLMARRTAWSTLVGGAMTYGIIAPSLRLDPAYPSIVRVLVWPAAALLVASALTELALDLPRLRSTPTQKSADVRVRWWLLAPAAVAMTFERFVFGLPWQIVLASLPLAAAIAYVSARSMGETDVVPTKALAPLAQGVFGAMSDGYVGPTIGPNLTGAVAIHAADTLGSVKVSTLLGVPMRAAVVARVIGCALGAVVVVLAYRAIVPDARALPTTELPAPGVLVWKAVAEAVSSGALPRLVHTMIGLGAAAGVFLTLVDRFVPHRARAFVPSAMGIGSGMVLPFSSALSIAIGALLRALRERHHDRDSFVAMASGMVAGESIAGVILQLVS